MNERSFIFLQTRLQIVKKKFNFSFDSEPILLQQYGRNYKLSWQISYFILTGKIGKIELAGEYGKTYNFFDKLMPVFCRKAEGRCS